VAQVFQFDCFDLNVQAYELRRAGRKVKLQRVPMELLIFLVERNGALVTREEIASRLWNSDPLADTQGSINTAVRKIRQALRDDGQKPCFVETVVGKGYRFIGPISVRTPPRQIATTAQEPATAKPEIPLAAPKSRMISIALAGFAGIVAVGAIALFLHARAAKKTPPLVIVPFTSLAGQQSWPSFSPDGNQVAFGWTGEVGNCSHLYVKPVDGASATKLTDSSECDSSPSWSRDGRSIAFLRKKAGGQLDGHLDLYVVSASGVGPQRISTLDGPSEYRPAWTPDGKALVVMNADHPSSSASLFRVALDSGEMRRITIAESTGTGDWCPAYSPDGRMLAFLHNTGSRRLSRLYIVPADARGLPSGSPRRIDTGSAGFTDLDWSADGRSLICAGSSGLVRVTASSGRVEPLPFPDGAQLTVALHGNRMIYARPFHDTDIFRVAGPNGLEPVTRLISSTRSESAPQYSADGTRIAFVSDGTGWDEIWVADNNGQGAHPITSFQGPNVGSPRWSPDGRWIAFDSAAGAHAGIYLVAAQGGAPRRVTAAAISCVRPSWSHDGQWIYHGSDQSGDWNIWKMAPQGGQPVQITRNGGREAFEAPGGEFVYFTKTPPECGIWRVPVAGGTEVRVSDGGAQGRWAIGGLGFYYLQGPGSLLFQAFATAHRSPILTPGVELRDDVSNMMGAAPDDRFLLLTVLVRSEVNLILAKNFE
jgi:Tol biopolymer transport system component/DNA-binding winged helix-turn-helix (wHTH) protein